MHCAKTPKTNRGGHYSHDVRMSEVLIEKFLVDNRILAGDSDTDTIGIYYYRHSIARLLRLRFNNGWAQLHSMVPKYH